MKKLLSSPLLFLLFSVSCISISQPIEAQSSNIPDVKVGGFTVHALSGWDIYKAGNYRYGPSIMRNKDGSLDAWFAAAGSSFQNDAITTNYTPLYSTSSDHSAVLIKSINVAAQKFTTTKPFFSIDINTPTWSRNGLDSITFTLYKWDTSYSKTLQGTPISTYRYTDLCDNQWIELRSNNNSATTTSDFFPAGSYLWTLSKGSTQAGVWFCSTTASGISQTSFKNGSAVTGCFQSALFYNSHELKYGYGNYWDQISYQHSTNNGKTWTIEKMVLKPTFGTEDQLSCCDPGVAKWGDYYYIGYTSTQNTAGIDNSVYVARSKSPSGPWDKWNGSGWGGTVVAPVIKYTGNHSSWGAGEPCMVIKDKMVYFYYSWNDNTTTTRLSMAPADSANWPALLKSYGTVINKTTIYGADHCDIKYCDSLKLFIAVHTADRMTANSKIYVWYSSNGRYFVNAGTLQGQLQGGLHNCGISGDEQGHMDIMQQQFISYAYGSSWGAWNTYFNPLQFAKNGVPVGIQSILTNQFDSKTPIYTLDGRKIGISSNSCHLQPGIYIINKKKVLIR